MLLLFFGVVMLVMVDAMPQIDVTTCSKHTYATVYILST